MAGYLQSSKPGLEEPLVLELALNGFLQMCEHRYKRAINKDEQARLGLVAINGDATGW